MYECSERQEFSNLYWWNDALVTRDWRKEDERWRKRGRHCLLVLSSFVWVMRLLVGAMKHKREGDLDWT